MAPAPDRDDGATIVYDYRGAGDQALVFVHCWCCDRSFWAGQVDEFAKDYMIVTVDLGGHGGSTAKREDWTVELFGGDVAAVVKKLDLKQAILIE